METLYVWLLTFAAATMVGCFLSSERELGKQRREINWLRRNHRPSEAQGSETHASAELLTRNKELSELTKQLQASQETIRALEAEQQRLGGVNFENQQLRQEIATFQNQLQTSEFQLTESAWQNQEAAERYAQLQNEIVELKQQAEVGQRPAGELEAVQEQLDTVESREMIFREQQHKLEAQIENLQRKLSMEKEAVQELDATCKRFAGMERVCQELREENRRRHSAMGTAR